MTFSTIKTKEIAEYLRLVYDDLTADEVFALAVILDAAKQFVLSQTNKDEDFLDTKADIVMLVYACCQHMYDNRCFIIERTNINPMVQTILEQYAENFIV